MKYEYNHTQIGSLVIWIFLIVSTLYTWLFLAVLSKLASPWFLFGMILFLLFLVASFSTLNVKIYDGNLVIKFGYGLYKRKFLLKEIKSVKEVKNHWYYGWGIRWWPKPEPGVTIYNVSGFGAVEIKLKKGQLYRIGTNKPKELAKAILKNIRWSPAEKMNFKK